MATTRFRHVQERVLLGFLAVVTAFAVAGSIWPDRLGVERSRAITIAWLAPTVVVVWVVGGWLARVARDAARTADETQPPAFEPADAVFEQDLRDLAATPQRLRAAGVTSTTPPGRR